MVMVTKAKKSSKKTRKQRVKHITKTDTHFMVRRSLLVYAVLVFIFFWLATMSTYLVDRMLVEHNNTAYADKVRRIYRSLNLDDSYKIADYNNSIPNDKSISIAYGHNASVSETRTSLSKKIKEAGFALISSSNKGTIVQNDTFKDSAGHVLSLSVMPRALHNDQIYGTSTVAKPYANRAISEFNNEQASYVAVKISL